MAITYDQALKTIQSQFQTNWTYTPVAYDNVEPRDFSDPVQPLLSDLQTPYIGVKVLFEESYAAETGPNAIKRTWGSIETSFFTRLSSGASTNSANIDNLSNLFEYKVIGGIVFKELMVLTPIPTKGWYVTPTLLRFYFNR